MREAELKLYEVQVWRALELSRGILSQAKIDKRTAERDVAKAAVEGSSFYDLPLVLHWFTGNIGYHHIHHLASRIPNYNLRACFESNPLLRKAPTLTIWQSLRCVNFKLWDEELQRMVGFPKRTTAR